MTQLLSFLQASRDDWRAGLALWEQRRRDAEEHAAREREAADQASLKRLAKVNGRKETERLTEERVDVIVRMMTDGGYVAGQTDQVLADVWSLSVVRVQQLAAEASRVIRRYAREHPDVGREALALTLMNWDRIRAKAEALGDARGFMVALRADELKLEYLGMKPAAKVDVTQKNPFESWTDEELEEYARTGKRPERPGLFGERLH